MKNMNWAFASLFLLISTFAAWAQTAKSSVAPRMVNQEVGDWVTQSEKRLVAMAEDMPEDTRRAMAGIETQRAMRANLFFIAG